MVQDPENIVLTQLREIRATLAGHSARFDRFEDRFDQLNKRLDDFHALVSHTRGPHATSSLKVRAADQGQEVNEGHQRTDERIDEVERRLSKVEDKLDK